jgi:hypothetical protein
MNAEAVLLVLVLELRFLLTLDDEAITLDGDVNVLPLNTRPLNADMNALIVLCHIRPRRNGASRAPAEPVFEIGVQLIPEPTRSVRLAISRWG